MDLLLRQIPGSARWLFQRAKYDGENGALSQFPSEEKHQHPMRPKQKRRAAETRSSN